MTLSKGKGIILMVFITTSAGMMTGRRPRRHPACSKSKPSTVNQRAGLPVRAAGQAARTEAGRVRGTWDGRSRLRSVDELHRLAPLSAMRAINVSASCETLNKQGGTASFRPCLLGVFFVNGREMRQAARNRRSRRPRREHRSAKKGMNTDEIE